METLLITVFIKFSVEFRSLLRKNRNIYIYRNRIRFRFFQSNKKSENKKIHQIPESNMFERLKILHRRDLLVQISIRNTLQAHLSLEALIHSSWSEKKKKKENKQVTFIRGIDSSPWS